MITVYTICYNEEFMLPYFIGWYRTMFPGCRIVVYDNESTDKTVAIAKANKCEVVSYSTDDELSDSTYLEIKNNCWKDAKTDWVIVADCDELCCIATESLRKESNAGVTIISFEGYNMVNMNNDMHLMKIDSGVRAESYDKSYCFRRTNIKEINYQMGCHKSNPVGDVTPSVGLYYCLHYKYINPDYMVKRHALFASRLSEENIRKGYGGHYLYTEKQIREEFDNARKQAIKIL